MSTNLMSGAKILLECMVREGVECFFGYPGGVTLPFYDALYDHHIRHVLVRHEENAAFAAEGYARATGKVGVCCATSGPGATNLITGLVDSMMDSIPIVAITGQVHSSLIGSDAFQEADTFGLTRSCTKHNFMVKTVAELPQIVHEAFYIAASGRPGPVLVDIHPAEIGKNRTPDIPIVGDVKRVLEKLNKAAAEMKPSRGERNEAARRAWWEQIRAWKEQFPLAVSTSDTEIKPQHLMWEID